MSCVRWTTGLRSKLLCYYYAAAFVIILYLHTRLLNKLFATFIFFDIFFSHKLKISTVLFKPKTLYSLDLARSSSSLYFSMQIIKTFYTVFESFPAASNFPCRPFAIPQACVRMHVIRPLC